MRYVASILALTGVIGCRDAVQPAAPAIAAQQAASEYEVIDLGSLPLPAGPAGEALDINNQGQVVGWSGPGTPMPGGRVAHAFVWENGVMTDLGSLGGSRGFGLFINNRGQVAGSRAIGGGRVEGFLWEHGVEQTLGDLGGGMTRPSGLSESGVVVGSSTTAAGATHAFLWRDGVLQDLGTLGGDQSEAFAVNNDGLVVGESRTAGGETHAFLWDASGLHDLGTLSGTFSTARGISNAGAVTGQSADATGALHAFWWRDGLMQDLGTLGGAFETSIGRFVNSAGQVAGEAFDRETGAQRGVFWDQDGIHDLGTPAPSSSSRTFVAGLNARGQVTGVSSLNVTPRAFTWEDGALLELPSQPRHARGLALNARGDVVGYVASSNVSPETHKPVLWRRVER